MKDGWNNTLKKIGESRDLTTNTNYTYQQLKTILRQELNAIYTKNWLAGKIVNIPVDDALKDKRILQCEDSDKLEILEKMYKKYHINDKLKHLFKWSKVFGSAVLIFITNDDEMDKPLLIHSLKKDCLKNIVVLDRFDVNSINLDSDPLSARYLKPEYYSLNGSSQHIHHSRVIQIDGCDTTNWNRQLLNGFGLSIFENAMTEIMNATLSPQLLINLIAQSNVDVFKIAGLNDSLSEDDDDLIAKRLEVVMECKSIFNGIALDKEDDYTNVTKSFAGLSEINSSFYQIVAGVFDIPYTRLMGASSTGLNAVGSGELKNYYDKIVTEQSNILEVLDRIDTIMQISCFSEPIEGFKSEYPSLFQKTDEEISIINKRDAETKEIYNRMGVINEMEAKASLVDNPLFPTITAQSLEEEKALYEEMDNIDYSQSENENVNQDIQEDDKGLFTTIKNKLMGI